MNSFKLSRPAYQFILPITIGILLLAVLQDYLFSVFYSTGFYWNESLLFNVFWLLLPLFVWGTFQLNKRWWPYQESLWLLIGLHIASCSCLSFAYLWMTSSLISFLAIHCWGLPFGQQGVMMELIFDNSLFLLLLYFATFIFQHKTTRKQTKTIIPNLPSKLQVVSANKKIFLSFDQIDSIHTNSPYAIVIAHGKKYHASENLKTLEQMLAHSNCHRIHRNCLLNLSKVTAIQSRGNGDYDLEVEGAVHRLSRRYSQAIKTHLRSDLF